MSTMSTYGSVLDDDDKEVEVNVPNVAVSKKSVSSTSRFVTKVLQENVRRSDVTFLVQTFWTPPCVSRSKLGGIFVTRHHFTSSTVIVDDDGDRRRRR